MNRIFAIKLPSAKKLSSFLLCLTCAAGPAFAAGLLTTVNLGSAAPFSVLAGTEVTSTGSAESTVVTGNLGVSPGTSVTGFSPITLGASGVVIGTIYTPTEVCTFKACKTETSTVAAHAQASLTVAYNDAEGRTGPCPCTAANTNLAGETLAPGLYKANSTLTISGGTLYLSGRGVYIFQVGTALNVTNASIVLENGAAADDIFWQVGTAATLTSVSKFEGTILANTAITMTADTTLVGRALAKAQVTLISDTVTLP